MPMSSRIISNTKSWKRVAKLGIEVLGDFTIDLNRQSFGLAKSWLIVRAHSGTIDSELLGLQFLVHRGCFVLEVILWIDQIYVTFIYFDLFYETPSPSI